MRNTFSKILTAVLIFVLILAMTIPASASTPQSAVIGSFMEVKQAELQEKIDGTTIPSTSFSDQGADGKNSNTRLAKSKVGISDLKMFEVTRTTADTKADNSKRRLATIYTDRKSTIGAEAYMYYIELPETLENPIIEIAWNLYQGNSDAQKNGHIYTGTMYVLEVGGTSWAPVKIEGRMSALPTGFKGYVMLNPKECMKDGDTEVGKNFDSTWQLLTTHIYVHNLNNETVTVSAPFIVSNFKKMSSAVYINGDKSAVKDIFTGEALTNIQAVKPNVGDVLYTLPQNNGNRGIAQPDASYLPAKTEITWNQALNEQNYFACLFEVRDGFYGEEFVLVKEVETTAPSATFEEFTVDTEYIVVVYSTDSNGDIIGISEAFSFVAKQGENFGKSDEGKEGGMNITLIIIIVAAVVVVAVAVLLIVLLSKKKKA